MSDEQGPRIRQDNEREAPAPAGPRPTPLRDDVVMALRFFSRLPTGNSPFGKPELNRIAFALPFASLIIGIGPAVLVALLARIGVPSYFAAALGVAAMLVVTGAMTDDAIADAMDGLFGGATLERRLEIMKDSRHGTYGVAALCLYIVLRVAALGAVAVINPFAAGGIWLAATIVARSGALWLSVDLPNARQGGASASAGRVSKPAFVVGAVFASVLALILAGPFTSFLAVLLALVATAAIAWGWSWTCRRLIGGQTGDLIGALHALIETGVLMVLLIFA